MFRGLIISPDSSTRAYLKSAVDSTGLFMWSGCCRSFQDALEHLRVDSSIDIIFVAQAFGEDEIVAFLESSRKLPQGRSCTYILLTSSAEPERVAVINGMIAGIHAFLGEPYSSITVQESVKLAMKVSSVHSRLRLKVASGLLLTDIVDNILRATIQHSPLAEKRGIIELMKECSRYFHKVTGKSLLGYADNIGESLLDLPPKKRIAHTGKDFRTAVRKHLQLR